jgi:serine/threonine protein kinase
LADPLGRLTAALADRYRLDRELGAGGMATVYLAHDLKHERRVAIKVLHEDLGATLGPERFLAEIKTTAKLQHPNILEFSPLTGDLCDGRRSGHPATA